jgi:hypothetical protein
MKYYPISNEDIFVWRRQHGFKFDDYKSSRMIRAICTGEFREPNKGEWYISGAIPVAYCAPNDLGIKFHIARFVELKLKEDYDPYYISSYIN